MKRAILFVLISFQSVLSLPAQTACQWSQLGSGITSNTNTYLLGRVFALATMDDGTGPALYAGGRFTHAGGIPAAHIARWDGTSWTTLGSGVSSIYVTGPKIEALRAFNDGSGSALYAAGFFSIAGSLPVNNIARWDGSTWSPLGSGLTNFGFVYVLEVFDDGSGPALYAAGNFSTAGGAPANNIARWNGSSWSCWSRLSSARCALTTESSVASWIPSSFATSLRSRSYSIGDMAARWEILSRSRSSSRSRFNLRICARTASFSESWKSSMPSPASK